MSDYTIDSMVTITGAEYERMRADLQKLNERNAEYIGTIDRLRRRVAETDVEIERLRALLEPFGKAADGFDGYNIKNPEEWFAYGGVQGSGETTGAITVGDLRRARAALAEEKKG